MIKQGAQTLDNGEAETEAGLIGLRAVHQAIELVENLALLVFGDAGPAVRHLDVRFGRRCRQPTTMPPDLV
jgi:hypothetical protein